MKILKEMDFTVERQMLKEVDAAYKRYMKKRRALDARLDERAAEYFGPDGICGFLRTNSRVYMTEDGFEVNVRHNMLQLLQLQGQPGNVRNYALYTD
jgi:hypothetical protein